MLISLHQQATIEPLSAIGPRTMARAESSGIDPGKHGTGLGVGRTSRHDAANDLETAQALNCA